MRVSEAYSPLSVEDRYRLVAGWRESGIEPGDTIVLHSSLRRTLERLAKGIARVRPAEILESFLEAVGPNGTLVFPTFNFDFTFGAQFDLDRSPSHMGVLGETARQDPRSFRTAHPVYSFAVIGAAQNSFRGKKNISAWGADSPFATVHDLGGKIAILDVPDRHSMTFFHYVEEACQVSFRYHKYFEGEYIQSNQDSETSKYSIFVRDVESGVVPCLDEMGEKLWEHGIYKGERPGEGNGLRVGCAVEIFDLVKSVIQSGKAEGLLYTIDHDVVRSHRAKWEERTQLIQRNKS